MEEARAGSSASPEVLGKSCPLRNWRGREYFRKREKKLVTAKFGLEGFVGRFASVAWVDVCFLDSEEEFGLLVR